ncbi:MAG: hypothetical protein H0V66_04905 [Bdellovibrionales bacterium]|nr:hypothetical protein [Bdellovibrionales bacterium]
MTKYFFLLAVLLATSAYAQEKNQEQSQEKKSFSQRRSDKARAIQDQNYGTTEEFRKSSGAESVEESQAQESVEEDTEENSEPDLIQ